MKNPRHLVLTVRDSHDLAEREAFERESFRRFLGLRVGRNTFPVLAREAIDFAWSHFQRKEPDPKRRDKKFHTQVKLLARFARDLDQYHEQHGDWPRVRDLLKTGISSPEVSADGDWHAHRHIIYDGALLPWALWCVLWRKATKGDAFVVHVSYKRPSYKTVQELIKYILKPTDLTPEQAEEFRTVYRHAKKIWRIGDASPVEPVRECPFCGSADCRPEPWTYQRAWSWRFSADCKTVTLQLASGMVTLRRVDGVWRDWWSLDSLYLRHAELTQQNRARDGPEVASQVFTTDLLDAAFGTTATGSVAENIV